MESYQKVLKPKEVEVLSPNEIRLTSNGRKYIYFQYGVKLFTRVRLDILMFIFLAIDDNRRRTLFPPS